MDEWECLDRIQARGDLHTPGRSPDEALGIAAFAAMRDRARSMAIGSMVCAEVRCTILMSSSSTDSISMPKVVASDDGGSAEGGSHRLCGGGE